MPLQNVTCKTLQASVWDCDRLQENLFLGAVTIALHDIDLTKETIRWYKLANLQRLI